MSEFVDVSRVQCECCMAFFPTAWNPKAKPGLGVIICEECWPHASAYYRCHRFRGLGVRLDERQTAQKASAIKETIRSLADRAARAEQTGYVTPALGLRQRPGDQPLPVKNEYPVIQDLVMADIEERKKLGISRYGTALQPFNGRDVILDVYQELLDAAIYMRQVIFERDKK